MRKLFKTALAILVVFLVWYFIGKKTTNEALGGPVTIEFIGWKFAEKGHHSKTNRTVELNYDLKKTIDHSKSVMWFCKCPVQDDLIIDGEVYTIFGDCSSQKGCQLVEHGDKYYLIKETLNIVDK